VRTAAHATTTPTPFPTRGLATGARPGIPWASATKPAFQEGNWRLHRSDGTVVRLPRMTWGTWATIGRGAAIGMSGTEAGPELQRVTGRGTVSARFVRHFGLAVSPDHRIVGRLDDRGAPRVLEGGGSRSFRLSPVPKSRTIGAIQGSRTCREQAPEGGGCTVFVNGRRHAFVSTSHGIVDRIDPMLAVTDVTARGRVIGLVSRPTPDSRECWGVYGPAATLLFQTCDERLDSFAPGGGRVLAERSRTKWDSVRHVAILGRDGHVVHSWTFDAGPRRSLSQLTWEDAHHLLGALQVRGHWSLVRIGTDGTVEYAVPPTAGAHALDPFNLPLR
jgi:hypothetical protein